MHIINFDRQRNRGAQFGYGNNGNQKSGPTLGKVNKPINDNLMHIFKLAPIASPTIRNFALLIIKINLAKKSEIKIPAR